MPKQESTASGPNRRSLIKLGAYGICSICLAGIPGCAIIDLEDEATTPDSAGNRTQKGLIGIKRSPWFSELENSQARCELCPRLCKLQPGERAPCLVRENRDGEIYSLVFGNPALVQEDPVERKPFFHVLPGSRALSISTAGCNLACKFCEVWDMALVRPEEIYAYDIPPQQVVEHALAAGVSSVSYAFGEPVVFYEYMSAVAEMAKQAGLKNLMHTAGYIQPEPLLAIAKMIDAFNIDLKGFDPNFYLENVGGKLETVLENLLLLRDMGVHLEITTIIIPTLNDDMATIAKMCRWIATELGEDVPLHFARFYPLYQLSALPRTPVSALEQARNMALNEGLKYVYIAKVTGHEGENTYCAGCGDTVINRAGFVIEENKLSEGTCPSCDTVLPGLWS